MTTTLTYTREVRERGDRIIAVLARSGILPDETTLAALGMVREQMEGELSGTMAADLLTRLRDLTVDSRQSCVTCLLPVTAHFDGRRQWVGCAGAMEAVRRV